MELSDAITKYEAELLQSEWSQLEHSKNKVLFPHDSSRHQCCSLQPAHPDTTTSRLAYSYKYSSQSVFKICWPIHYFWMSVLLCHLAFLYLEFKPSNRFGWNNGIVNCNAKKYVRISVKVSKSVCVSHEMFCFRSISLKWSDRDIFRNRFDLMIKSVMVNLGNHFFFSY